ncbi:hypothetical protein F5Y14DRAFT_58754 [Nemania sp. NC0429]|nr:hypothetical protein F5Y14DRAFT_58754 [Nemania sp. NC0429]
MMTSRIRKSLRYESGPDHNHSLRQPCSPGPDNSVLTQPATSYSTPSDCQRFYTSHGRVISDLDIRPAPPITVAATPKRRAGSTSLVDLHQPIGFVCCQCRYHSSGMYCSNPGYAQCPHQTLPRCGNCPIIFTSKG